MNGIKLLNPNNQSVFGIFARCMIVVISAIWLFYIDEIEGVSPIMWTLVLVLLCFSKTIYFVWVGYQKIIDVTIKDAPFHKFIIFACMNISVFILSFTFDFFGLYLINPDNYEGMPVNYSNPRLLFEFLFFSLQQFTFFGYGNLLPSSVLAKILSMLELTISFLTVLFILSDFNSLKESLLTRVDTRKDEDE